MARNPVTKIIITAKDEASAVFSGLRAHAGKIATAIAGYFSAKLFGDVVGAARDFESAMSAVQAAAGASGAGPPILTGPRRLPSPAPAPGYWPAPARSACGRRNRV